MQCVWERTAVICVLPEVTLLDHGQCHLTQSDKDKRKRKNKDEERIVQLSWLRSGMDGEGFYVPGWDSIPLEIEIGLQPFPNPWSMFSQYFRSSGEKTKSRSRICKPSELVLIGEEISRNVNVCPSSPQVMVDSFATDSVFIVPSAWLQMLRGKNLSTG